MGKLKFRPVLNTLKRVGKHVFMPGKVALGTLSAVSKHAPYVLNKILLGERRERGMFHKITTKTKLFQS